MSDKQTRPTLSSSRVHSITGSLHNIKGSILNVSRIRDTIAARKEKEILETNYAKRPLTHRNVETLLEAQRVDDACNPLRSSRQLQISEWIQLVSSVWCDLCPANATYELIHYLSRTKTADGSWHATPSVPLESWLGPYTDELSDARPRPQQADSIQIWLYWAHSTPSHFELKPVSPISISFLDSASDNAQLEFYAPSDRPCWNPLDLDRVISTSHSAKSFSKSSGVSTCGRIACCNTGGDLVIILVRRSADPQAELRALSPRSSISCVVLRRPASCVILITQPVGGLHPGLCNWDLYLPPLEPYELAVTCADANISTALTASSGLRIASVVAVNPPHGCLEVLNSFKHLWYCWNTVLRLLPRILRLLAWMASVGFRLSALRYPTNYPGMGPSCRRWNGLASTQLDSSRPIRISQTFVNIPSHAGHRRVSIVNRAEFEGTRPKHLADDETS